MPQSGPKKIVYLFGAGATHAELANLYPTLVEKGRGLLISNVSRRVIEKARSIEKYLSRTLRLLQRPLDLSISNY
jgi:hypothetical protein